MSSSQLLLRLPSWVVVRMARSRAKECHGCGRWKLRFLAALVLSCVLGCLWVLCEVENCGFLWRKERGRVVVEERPQVSLEQFNLNKSQLQALAFLLSAMGQVLFLFPWCIKFVELVDLGHYYVTCFRCSFELWTDYIHSRGFVEQTIWNLIYKSWNFAFFFLLAFSPLPFPHSPTLTQINTHTNSVFDLIAVRFTICHEIDI